MDRGSFEFQITLVDIHPEVWRSITVPRSCTFYQLHIAIQGAFGWENAHLFEFSKKGLQDTEVIGIPFDEMEDDRMVRDAKLVQVKSIFKKVGARYLYVYDFGDYWQHELLLKKIRRDDDLDRPYCLGGAGACPPEDVGGTSGYEEMIRVFRTAGDPEKESYREWLNMLPGEDWNPFRFNSREANKRFALLENWLLI